MTLQLDGMRTRRIRTNEQALSLNIHRNKFQEKSKTIYNILRVWGRSTRQPNRSHPPPNERNPKNTRKPPSEQFSSNSEANPHHKKPEKQPKTQNNPQNTPNHQTPQHIKKNPKNAYHMLPLISKKSGPSRIRTGGFRLVKAAS